MSPGRPDVPGRLIGRPDVPGGLIGRPDVLDAAGRIRPHVRRTPVMRTEIAGRRAWLKLEHLQHSGAFKFRGAMTRLLAADPQQAVIAASGGNHGIAVALAGSRLERRVRVFVPTTAPEAKKAAIRRTGAQLVEEGAIFSEAEAAAREIARTHEAVYVHPYDDPLVAAGQGTAALEALTQVPGMDLFVVAVGGGGLLAGSLAALDGLLPAAAVESTGSPTLAAALAAGQPVDVAVGAITDSALGASRISARTLAMAQEAGTAVAQVDDVDVVRVQRLLWEEHRLVLEPAGAIVAAALAVGALDHYGARNPCLLLCGANVEALPPPV